jgi:hypothetical protein
MVRPRVPIFEEWPLDSARKQQYNHNYEEKAYSAAGIIAPVPTVIPIGYRAEQRQYQDNDQKRSEHGILLGKWLSNVETNQRAQMSGRIESRALRRKKLIQGDRISLPSAEIR